MARMHAEIGGVGTGLQIAGRLSQFDPAANGSVGRGDDAPGRSATLARTVGPGRQLRAGKRQGGADGRGDGERPPRTQNQYDTCAATNVRDRARALSRWFH